MSAARSAPLRAVEWFWRAETLREARAQAPYPHPGQRELVQRARVADEAAERLLEPNPPFDSGSAAELSIELCRQSIYWSLLASSPSNEPAPSTSADWGSLRGRLSATPERVRAELGETPASLEQLERALFDADFRTLVALPAGERIELARRAKRVAHALVESLLEPARRVESLWFQRVGRSGAVLVALIAVAAASFGSSGGDLAAGRPWRASSLGFSGCTSPAQDCGAEYFFHTQTEERPWLELDLGSSQKFSAVRVHNRGDCCGERAVPLVVEVSDDGKHFRQVARRDEAFRDWTAHFRSVSARYVRVRALRNTALHLRRVEVLK